MWRLLRWLPVPVLLPLAAWWGWHALHAPPVALAVPGGASLEWTECWFDKPLWRPLHCGRLHTTPEPGTAKPGFSLPVVYLPALRWRAPQAPVVYIAGGPGGAAGLDGESFPSWLPWLEQVDWSADVILYDQRGVGLSEPALSCPEMLAERRKLLDSGLPTEQEYALMRRSLLACRDRLLGEGWNLGRFNSRHNADDVFDLVKTLGLPRWRVYGVSYGSRVAMEILRRRPPGLEAVILDSVYPPQIPGEASDTWLLNRSLQLFMRSCELISGCEYNREQLRASLEDAMARLRDRPLRLELRDPDNGHTLPVLLDQDDLAWLIFESQYQWSNIKLLPGAISSLARGHVSAELRGMLQESLDTMLDDSLSEAVGNSVDCADNGPFARARFMRQLRQFPLVAGIRQHDWDFGACRDWLAGDTGADFRQVVHSDVPTLLLAGEFDPVTPPQWAYAAAEGLSNGHVFTFPGIGHGVLDSDSCGVEVVRAFLADPQNPQVPDCLGLF